MSTPSEPAESESTYVIDAENAAEMARLMNQALFLTKRMGGLFPERSDLANIHDVLDIACGPGGWVLDVARSYPSVQVIGIDISQIMVAYARALAATDQLTNARFRLMNALTSLDFPDHSFDLVNARLVAPFMPSAAWPALMQECQRILRPGGVIRLTEAEAAITNSPAFEKIIELGTGALKLAGQSFSPDGRHIGITPILGRFLRDAGYTHIQRVAYAIDSSAGTEANKEFCQDYMVAFKLVQPFLIKMGVMTQGEIDRLYQQIMTEMQLHDFCSILFLLTVWGEKPR